MFILYYTAPIMAPVRFTLNQQHDDWLYSLHLHPVMSLFGIAEACMCV